VDQAEQLRNVVKLQRQNIPKPAARVITVTSGKGGVGKSNTTVNLAIWLSKKGKRVVILDADIGLANVEVMFGAIPKFNLSDLIYRGKNITEIITPGPMNIGFISGGSGILGLNNLTREQIGCIVGNMIHLDEIADIILIDTGAGISDSVLEFALASPEILLVMTPDPSSLTDSYSLVKALYKNPSFQRLGTKINVISNRVNSTEEGRQVYEKLDTVTTRFLQGEIQYLGMVPEDRAIERAIRQQMPVSLMTPSARASKAYEILADNLLGYETKQMIMRKGITQIFAGMMNR
jgi:flagellar biosynthesis protein FlhG